mgnify:CR=1 FL=1
MENNIWKEIYDFYYLANLFLLGNDVSQGHAILNRGDELLSRNLTNEVRIQTLFILASVSEKMAIKEELGFLDKIITLDLTNDSYLKAMLRKANYHMRNEETDQGYNLGRCLVDESINRNNEIYLMQGWEFLGKYYFENNRYEEAIEAYAEMRTLAQKIGKPGEIFRAQLKLGIIWNLMGNVGIALEYLLNASTFAHDNKMPIDCAIADSLRASIFSSIGCHNEVSELLKNSGKIFESL